MLLGSWFVYLGQSIRTIRFQQHMDDMKHFMIPNARKKMGSFRI